MFNLRFLGTGEPEFEEGFRYFAAKYPEKCAAVISFDIDWRKNVCRSGSVLDAFCF